MATPCLPDYSISMRHVLFTPLIPAFSLAVCLAGCASDMRGKWPSLAPRAGEVTEQTPVTATGACAGCGQDMVAAPPAAATVPQPPPADTEARLAAITAVIAGVEESSAAKARTAVAAISAARRDPARSADAEVERSRYESLFLPLSVEDRRLELLGDDVAGRTGADVVLARIAALQARLAALQDRRTSLPE